MLCLAAGMLRTNDSVPAAAVAVVDPVACVACPTSAQLALTFREGASSQAIVISPAPRLKRTTQSGTLSASVSRKTWPASSVVPSPILATVSVRSKPSQRADSRSVVPFAPAPASPDGSLTSATPAADAGTAHSRAMSRAASTAAQRPRPVRTSLSVSMRRSGIAGSLLLCRLVGGRAHRTDEFSAPSAFKRVGRGANDVEHARRAAEFEAEGRRDVVELLEARDPPVPSGELGLDLSEEIWRQTAHGCERLRGALTGR